MSDMSTDSSPPLVRRLFKYFAGFVVLLILAVLGGVIYLNWKGEREWQAFRSEWEAKGEKFDPKDFVPAAVPDEQNFATTPLLAALSDFTKPPRQSIRWNNPELKDRVTAIGAVFQNQGRRKSPAAGQWQLAIPMDLIPWQRFLATNSTDDATTPKEAGRAILEVLKPFDDELAELAVASARPHSAFRLDYAENYRMLLPHLAPLKGISQTLRLRAVARLAADDKQGAFEDVKLGLRFAELLKSEPLLISQLVRIASLQLAMQPLWEGAVLHDWSETQLVEFQQILAKMDFLASYGVATRTERAFGNATIDELRTGKMPFSSLGEIGDGMPGTANGVSRFIPSGWYRLNQLTLNRLFQEQCLPVIDAEKHRVQTALAGGIDEAPELKGAGVFNVFARLLLPAVGKSASKFAHAQASVDLALTACALERYRLKHGKYPANLDPLVPEFIELIPVDAMTGELPKYRLEADGRFVLYVVGWNQLDDAGQPGTGKSGNSVDALEGDWCWQFPAPLP